MPKPPKPVPEIVRVATELEAEMVQLESLAWSARKARLDSEKTITKAAADLNAAVAIPGRLAEQLQALGEAMARMQARQQAALEPLTHFAGEIQRRLAQLGQHMQAFAALGERAGELSRQVASGTMDQAGRADTDARLQELQDGARTLFEAARDDDFPDIAREADVLKQRMAAMRNRLKTLA